jgi:hypothetical protein
MKLTAMNATSHFPLYPVGFRLCILAQCRSGALLLLLADALFSPGDIAKAEPRSPVSAEALDQAGFALMKRESLGPLRLGISESAILSAIGMRPVKGKVTQWAGDGAYHQEWRYPDLGLILGLSSEKKSGVKVLDSVTAQAPCRLKTSRGVQIGSREKEVLAAYRAEYNREFSEAGVSIVAGSPYGGITFYIINNLVSRVFIGANAE